MIVHTKLWVDVKQGEDKGEFLIFLLSEESYEADKVVEQEWSQHRCSHLGVSEKTTEIVIVFVICTISNWIIVTLRIISKITMTIIIRGSFTAVNSSIKFADQIDISPNVEGWQSDVED